MFATVRDLGFVVGLLVLVALLVAALNLWARRAGYRVPGKAVVRCSRGHLFRTTWVEGGSLTMLRLGPSLRYGRCPVGLHWSSVLLVRERDLSEAERRMLDDERAA